MSRRINNGAIDYSKIALKIPKGGHESITASQGAKNLGIVTNFERGINQGLINLGSGNVSAKEVLPDIPNSSHIVLNGNFISYINKKEVYTIANYDSFKPYIISLTAGTINRTGRNLTFTPPDTVGPVTLTINDKVFTIDVRAAAPKKPVITSPFNGKQDLHLNAIFTTDAFVQSGDTSWHVATDWQFARDLEFTDIVKQSLNDTVNLTQYRVNQLSVLTNYFARVRFKASNGNYSEWSEITAFKTANEFAASITLSANTNNFILTSALSTLGWDGIIPLNVDVSINSGVNIGSTSVTLPAFDTGPVPAGSLLQLINNGNIIGKGGNGGSGGSVDGLQGGPALKLQALVTITNNGTIGGGGGGGGAGGCGPNPYSGCVGQGGGGGGGAGIVSGQGGTQNGYGSCTYSASAPGTSGTPVNGGAGGKGSYGTNSPNGYAFGGAGGTGGNLGAPGGAGALPYHDGEDYVGWAATEIAPYYHGNGGSGGPAIIGNAKATWLVQGSRLGLIID